MTRISRIFTSIAVALAVVMLFGIIIYSWWWLITILPIGVCALIVFIEEADEIKDNEPPYKL